MTSAKPRLVAHRGLHDTSEGGAVENTLAAIRHAVAAGADAIEVDVRVTRDGAVVLLHDPTLTRIWGDPRAVADVDLAELREFGGGDRRIPLLDDALELLRDTGVTLLIDMDEPTPATPAVGVVSDHEHRVENPARTAWCGDHAAMRTVRGHLPSAEIWQPWYAAQPPAAADLAELRPDVVNVEHLLVGNAFVAAVHTLGVRVSCWTVNEPAQIAHLASIGVDSITTDVLPAAQQVLVDGVTSDGRSRERSIVHALATRAAKATTYARHNGVGGVHTKSGPADHVTEVDRWIERTVREILGAQFPTHGVVGEEYGGTEASSCWFVDPIDGTANLVDGVPWTSFSLALVQDGRPVVGAVLDPLGPTPVTAAEGAGAWHAGQRLQLTPGQDDDPLAGMIVSTELAGTDAWPGLHTFLDHIAARHGILRIPGSGTATLAGVALGRGAGAIIHDYSPLDHAAALLIVREAGGVVLDADGTESPHPAGGAVIAARDARTAHAIWQEWHATQA